MRRRCIHNPNCSLEGLENVVQALRGSQSLGNSAEKTLAPAVVADICAGFSPSDECQCEQCTNISKLSLYRHGRANHARAAVSGGAVLVTTALDPPSFLCTPPRRRMKEGRVRGVQWFTPLAGLRSSRAAKSARASLSLSRSFIMITLNQQQPEEEGEEAVCAVVGGNAERDQEEEEEVGAGPLSPVASADPRDALALEGQLGPAGGRLLSCRSVRVSKQGRRYVQ
jgi:hypothetical protein